MIEREVLAKALERGLKLVRSQRGERTWSRVDDWTDPGRVPSGGERGGGVVGEAMPGDVVEDVKASKAAARLQGEREKRAQRILADLAWFANLAETCNPERPKELANRHKQVAQVAADRFCVSCWRDDGWLQPIPVKPGSGTPGVPYYRDLCRPCGEWIDDEGNHVHPPIEVVRYWHKRRVSAVEIERAIAGQKTTKVGKAAADR